MPRMISLDPAPKQPLPGNGWELIATEAGRYATGLRATIQVWNGDLQGCRQLALAYPLSWTDFATELASQTGMPADDISKTLLTLTGGVEGALRQMEQQAESRGVSQATQLVDLAAEAELFHSPDGDAFATIETDGHRETWPLRVKAFRRWLARRFYTEHDKAPGTQAVQDALTVLEGKALFDGPEYPVFTRLAEHQGAISLDLANERWEAIEITAAGWQMVPTPPVKFRRMRGMQPLPCPVPGGTIEDLRPLLNIADDHDWLLLKAWLVKVLKPKGSHPVLVIHGEQGSAKSTVSRVLRGLIDPNTAPLRAEPRDGRDLIIAATNSWIIGLDNLSHIQLWLSDAICRLAVGGGFATRELYTDGDEILFEAQRPVILNGIEELATRGDLLDRAIILYLPAIPEEKRRPEADIWHDFDALRPKVLAALLDAVSAALANMAKVKLERLPRMADFAVWAAAAAPKLGYDAQTFMKAYAGNRESGNELAMEASLITPSLRQAAEAGFTGTSTELLERLNAQAPEELKRQKSWPANGRLLSNALRRIAPNLRAVGINVDFDRKGKKGARTILLSSHIPSSSRPCGKPPSRPCRGWA